MLSATLVRSADDTRLWTITNINRDFLEGFLFGTFYALVRLNQEYEYTLVESPSNEHLTVDDTGMGMFAIPPVPYDLAIYYYNQVTPEIRQRHTALVTRPPLVTDRIYLFYIEGNVQSYLQGLFTALQGFNIPVTEVLLTQPFRNGQYFNVERLVLPQTL